LADRTGQPRSGAVPPQPNRCDLRNRLRGISIIGDCARKIARHRPRLLTTASTRYRQCDDNWRGKTTPSPCSRWKTNRLIVLRDRQMWWCDGQPKSSAKPAPTKASPRRCPFEDEFNFSALARTFCFPKRRTEKWRQRSSSHFLPPLSSPLHRPCSRRVHQAKHLVCSTRSPRKNTRASPSLSTLRCVRCKPKARRTSIRELSAMRPARF